MSRPVHMVIRESVSGAVGSTLRRHSRSSSRQSASKATVNPRVLTGSVTSIAQLALRRMGMTLSVLVGSGSGSWLA
jgi:hypothetical protein